MFGFQQWGCEVVQMLRFGWSVGAHTRWGSLRWRTSVQAGSLPRLLGGQPGGVRGGV